MILIVTYDLNGPAGSYDSFYEVLKQQGSWMHYLKSTWLISTNKTPNQVYESLAPYLQPRDRIFVAQMGCDYYGWLPKDAWDWISRQGH